MDGIADALNSIRGFNMSCQIVVQSLSQWQEKSLVRHDLIYVSKAPLLDRQQVPVCVLQIADIVDERHEQVQLPGGRHHPEP